MMLKVVLSCGQGNDDKEMWVCVYGCMSVYSRCRGSDVTAGVL